MHRRQLLQQAAATGAGVLILNRSARAATVLRFSHTDQPTGARQQAAELFARKVKEYTDGRYIVHIYPAGQLADDPKGVEQLRIGGIDFTVTSTGTYATHIASLNLTMLPYLVDTYEQGWRFYDTSKWLAAQFAKGPAVGFRFLSTFEAGFRDMTTKQPLPTPAAAKGMKLRSFPNEMMRWTLEAMGFQVIIMPLPEVYLAIQQGAVSGQENPIDTIYVNKFYEVAPYVTLTQHVYSPIPLTVSERTWQRFSPADQEAVAKAAAEAATWSRHTVRANDGNELKTMAEKGAKISRPALAPWHEVVQPVYAQAKAKWGADVAAILADADAIRKALPSS
jgi:tripartite ATP-independent transporter DctP family solute receptor